MTQLSCRALALTAFFLLSCVLSQAAEKATAVDYEKPALLTGTVYETASGTNRILFTFQRSAVRSNSTVHVTRNFLYPNGNLAARERAVFDQGKLISFHLDERQTGARGSATVRGSMLLFDWVEGEGAAARKKTDSEKLQPNTLVGDMIPYFIAAHWDELARGTPVNFRFIAQSRLETVGFKLLQESEVTWRGTPALRLRMEASNFLIARIVDPLFFIVEKSGDHRILEYVGRTTPKTRDGNKWKDLDARTVYDWH
jgi:hypothetical protein